MEPNELLTSSQQPGENSDPEGEDKNMEWHIYEHEDGSGNWVVQGINIGGEGEIFTTIFADSDAEARAREYYKWQSATAKQSIAA